MINFLLEIYTLPRQHVKERGQPGLVGGHLYQFGVDGLFVDTLRPPDLSPDGRGLFVSLRPFVAATKVRIVEKYAVESH
jgi:hypothetical protein